MHFTFVIHVGHFRVYIERERVMNARKKSTSTPLEKKIIKQTKQKIYYNNKVIYLYIYLSDWEIINPYNCVLISTTNTFPFYAEVNIN